MSYFIFGTFVLDEFSERAIQDVKQAFLDKELILHINKELEFSSDINKMLLEHDSDFSTKFCITSFNQKFNSQDILFPFDKYTREELFPNGEDRTRFEELCAVNLKILKDAIAKAIEIIQLTSVRIFVAEGYDTEFKIVKCNLEAMFEEILSQVKNSFFLTSTIYEI
jgi:hypothetical protein